MKAKIADGKYLDIVGGENCGKTIDIRSHSPEGIEYLLSAISPEGDMYDIKGIKLLDKDQEGYVKGYKEFIFYYAHVKALPPVE